MYVSFSSNISSCNNSSITSSSVMIPITSWNWQFLKYIYRPSMKLWEGNVFGHVCLSLYPQGGVPWDHYLWWIGPPCTAPSIPSRQGISLYMDLSAWASPVHGIPLYKPPPASDIWWPRLETCLNLFTWGTPLYSPPPHPYHHTGTDIWWLLKHVQLINTLILEIIEIYA